MARRCSRRAEAELRGCSCICTGGDLAPLARALHPASWAAHRREKSGGCLGISLRPVRADPGKAGGLGPIGGASGTQRLRVSLDVASDDGLPFSV